MVQTLDVLRSGQPMDCSAVVLSSTWLTPTIKSVWLELDRPEFLFLPGQALWPKFERDGKRFSKIYSIASSPAYCPRVELCVSRVGWSSAALQDLLPGDSILSRGAYGLLTLDRLPTQPRLYLAEGSGIAPIKSHLDWLFEQELSQPVWLIQSNPETPAQLPYRSHWRSLQQRWQSFHYLEAIDRSPEALLSQFPTLAGLEIDICAVNQRVDELYEAVLGRGASSEKVRLEKFMAF
ncbi:MAG: FAD-dependent oxidoreductase [Leptolyngbyaceae cyanobacterium SL_7_1]|nr:FAD-dependent oxidoreductase [Leptolyngbyaceae cyanobacterium SL_7_1]